MLQGRREVRGGGGREEMGEMKRGKGKGKKGGSGEK